MRATILAVLANAIAAGDVLAGQAETPRKDPVVVIEQETHYTSNALDNDTSRADIYQVLRGSIEHAIDLPDATLKLTAHAQATAYDKYSIEDDRSLALSADLQQKLGERVELRNTLSYNVSSEGDDLTLGDIVIGTRTLKQRVTFATQAGFDLQNESALIVSASAFRERLGTTKFEELILPSKLEPDQTRFQGSVALKKTLGPVVGTLEGGAEIARVEELGSPPVSLSFAHYRLRGEIIWKVSDKTTLAMMGGGEYLRDALGLYKALKPTYRVALVQALPFGAELRGSVGAAYDTSDTDDPLASWVRRAEIELKIPASERLAVGTGFFHEVKDNVLMENRERSHGVYAEVGYAVAAKLSILARVDYSRKYITELDITEKTVDTFVKARLSL